MIITCPSCSVRFVVKAEAIGAKGRKVKCAKCAHSWFQEPDAEALAAIAAMSPPPQEEPKAVDPLPDGANVPVVTKNPASLKHKLAFAAAAVFALLVISIAASGNILPRMSSYYSIFGLYDSKGFSLSDVKVEKVDSGNSKDLVISGKIVNDSPSAKHIPDLRLTVYNKDKKKLKEITLDSDNTKIEGGQAVDFQNKIARIPDDSETLVMDLGNYIDLASR